MRLHRVLRAPPARVYRAFLNAGALAKWIPPNGFTCTVHHMEARVGETFRMSFTNFTSEKSHSFGGEYLELVSERLIRYTDKFEDPNLPGVIQVTVSLKAGFLRHRPEYRAGRHSRGDTSRNVLSRLAGIPRGARKTRRAGNPGINVVIKIIVIVIVVLVGGVLLFAASRPDSFRVEGSASIKTPPEKIYAQINDLKSWAAWSPFEKKDPAMKRTFGAVTAGKGAVYEWDGNKNVGKGRMEITGTTQPSKIVVKLDFLEPFVGHNTTEFTMDGKDGATTVTWAMYGPANFTSKLMGVFFNMDRMIGTDFEAGLANLKSIAEK